mgnify:CR=1 FL=1
MTQTGGKDVLFFCHEGFQDHKKFTSVRGQLTPCGQHGKMFPTGIKQHGMTQAGATTVGKTDQGGHGDRILR